MGGESVLFDCGEGTQRQALMAGLRFSRLRLIAITHLHGDHVNGLFGLLGTLVLDGRLQPIRIVGPHGLRRLVDAARSLRLFSPAYHLDLDEFDSPAEVFRGADYRVVCHPLEHSIETLGYALIEDDRPGRFDPAKAAALGLRPGPAFGKLQRGEPVRLLNEELVRPEQVLGPVRPGRRIAYCLDTRPCDAAVRLASEADVLVHESTFADDAAPEAAAYAHSTSRQAAEVAAAAASRTLLLTHFSSRYDEAGISQLLSQAQEVFPAASLAEDFTRWDLGPAPPG